MRATWKWLAGGFLLGVAAGGVWRGVSPQAFPALPSAVVAGKAHEAREGTSPVAAVKGRGAQQETVEVEAAGLVRLMAKGRSSAVNMEQMLADTSEGLERILVIRAWAGLDDAEWHALIEVLRQAAEERRDWEMAHVRAEPVASEPGAWVLHFPADDGGLQAKLQGELRAHFTAEQAEAIELAGNLADFPYCSELDLVLADCAVKVKALRITNNLPNPAGDFVRFRMAAVPTKDWVEADIPVHALGEIVHPAKRLVNLLGSEREILAGATAAAEAAGK